MNARALAVVLTAATLLFAGCSSGTSGDSGSTGGEGSSPSQTTDSSDECPFHKDLSESAKAHDWLVGPSSYSSGKAYLADSIVSATVVQAFGCGKKAEVETTLTDSSDAQIVCATVSDAYAFKPPDESAVKGDDGSVLASC